MNKRFRRFSVDCRKPYSGSRTSEVHLSLWNPYPVGLPLYLNWMGSALYSKAFTITDEVYKFHQSLMFMGKICNNLRRVIYATLIQFLAYQNLSQAQVQSDGSVSTSVQSSPNTFIVTGGQQVGRNLFHSFRDFSVPNQGIVRFEAPGNVRHIISRVTGNSISLIDGLIQSIGKADFFLINPNGIIFDRHASLGIGGSFIASTAGSINFADGSFLSTNSTQTPLLLTQSIPAKLQFGPSPGPIVNRSAITNVLGLPIGLESLPGKTIALIGGNVSSQGGAIFAPSGNINLGSVSSGNSVILSPTPEGWGFEYDSVGKFQDIQLSEKSFLVTSGASSGTIQINGKKISITDDSQVVSFNFGNDLGGDIKVNASDLVQIEDNSNIATFALSSGAAGNIIINATNLSLQDNSFLDAGTLGGQGGNIIINVSDQIGVFKISRITSQSFGLGNAGNIDISTHDLLISNGGQITTNSRLSGDGGDISIESTGTIEISGSQTFNNPRTEISELVVSAIQSSSVGERATGNGGAIDIETRHLTVKEGAKISVAATEGSQGSAGTLNVDASQSVTVRGAGSTLQAESSSSRPAGDLNLTTTQLVVQQGGDISVSASGTGAAGNLGIKANSILLDQGQLKASTQAGEGNINLRTNDSLVLRRNSAITATALGNASGGNVTINSGIIAALENSDISADAERGRGGNVFINTQGIFRSPNSDITATSELGPQFRGDVEIITPGVDPTEGLIKLPESPVSTDGINRRCVQASNSESSSFVVTGKGGIATNPDNPLVEENPLVELATPIPHKTDSQVNTQDKNTVNTSSVPIVEAQGWILQNGTIYLVTEPPNLTMAASQPYQSKC